MRLVSMGHHRRGLDGLAGDGLAGEWFVEGRMGHAGSQVAGGLYRASDGGAGVGLLALTVLGSPGPWH